MVGFQHSNSIRLILSKCRRIGLLTHRDHRKILIVDGSVAFTGGVNISRVYSSSSLSGEHHEKNIQEAWRDTHVQIEGPAVAEFQKLFLETWARQNGPELAERNYFPTLKREGNDLVRVVGSMPGQEEPDHLYHVRICVHLRPKFHPFDEFLFCAR